MSKVPERMCVACKSKKEKHNLLRYVIQEGNVVLDNKKHISGRGFYLCNQITCVDLLKKKRILNRVLSRAVTEEEYDALKGNIHEKM